MKKIEKEMLRVLFWNIDRPTERLMQEKYGEDWLEFRDRIM
tara:strand:+ start:369 stop:491 length:123 start_codon:yes stop_codon:yes gene_type:complete